MTPSPLTRILYVEDDEDIQSVAGISLEQIGGFALLVCSSGHEAVEKAEAWRPDLFLLDVMMPGMDGPETLAALWRIPALSETPAIFMTAKVQPSEVAALKALGVLDVVPKPFDPMTLPDEIRAIWNRAHGG